MSEIQSNIKAVKKSIAKFSTKLVAVSKTKPIEDIQEAYEGGQRIFGENKVQELCDKQESLPKDIEWHMIGHLQSNKVKHIAPFVSLIHAVDSTKLLKEINKQGEKNNRTINCLLQVHIAKEESKFGFSEDEIVNLLAEDYEDEFPFVSIKGFMGMATNTENTEIVTSEFKQLHSFYNAMAMEHDFTELSIGMSGDYLLAVKEGSTMVRVGSAIFGKRNYTK